MSLILHPTEPSLGKCINMQCNANAFSSVLLRVILFPDHPYPGQSSPSSRGRHQYYYDGSKDRRTITIVVIVDASLVSSSLPDRNCNELRSTFPCDDICRLHNIFSGKTCSGFLVDCFSCCPHDWHGLSWRKIAHIKSATLLMIVMLLALKKGRQTSGPTAKYSPDGSFTSGWRSEVFLLLDNQTSDTCFSCHLSFKIHLLSKDCKYCPSN